MSAKPFLRQPDVIHEFSGPVDGAGNALHLFSFKEESNPFHSGILAKCVHYAVANQGLSFGALILDFRPEAFAQVYQQRVSFGRNTENIIFPHRAG